MFASIFDTLIVQPIFNLLVFVYALVPGHNFGLSIIVFTLIIRLLMWPLVKKQLHHTKEMRKLQPELKKIKKATKGDRQKEAVLLRELYKERGINPFSSLGVLALQLPILLGLYSGLTKLVHNPQALVDFTYPALRNLGSIKDLAANIEVFDRTLFGVVDLFRPALEAGGTYWPAMALVVGSAVSQYYQSKQLLPDDKDGRSLRTILRDAKAGKKAEQSEVSASMGRSMRFFIPVMIFIFTVRIASALSLYWLVSGIIAYIQQASILRRDEAEMEVLADKPEKKIIEGEVVAKKPGAGKKKPGGKNKRRKK